MEGEPYIYTKEGKPIIEGYTPKVFKGIPTGNNFRDRVLKKNNGRCVVCGTKENITLDHIHPRSLGGSYSFGNLQPMCSKHNSEKGSKVYP
jgi:5-methylcytosine-specific restriction endonuclease McrA